MGLFDSFRKKKEPDIPDLNFKGVGDFSTESLPPLPDREPLKVSYLDESELHDEKPLMETSFKSTSLENLCKRIDEENAGIEKQVLTLKKKVKELNMDNPEILDLLGLYEKTKERLDDFVRDIDRFDSIGWGADQNTAALYKFRACKGLANMKKQIKNIEKLSEDAGFTPQKVQEILNTPAVKLVDELVSGERKKK